LRKISETIDFLTSSFFLLPDIRYIRYIRYRIRCRTSFFFDSTVDFNSNEPYIRELTFDSPKQTVEFPKRGEKLE
jgi:hypothetical protein